MKLKALGSMLMLLLVSLQAFASACDMRCGTDLAKSPAAGSQTSGMAHCKTMASRSAAGYRTLPAISSTPPCASHIRNNEWVFLQSSAARGLDVTSPPAALPAPAAMRVQIPISLQVGTGRNLHSIPAFDPLISRLRI